MDDNQRRTVILMFNVLFGTIFLTSMFVVIWAYWDNPVMRTRFIVLTVGVAVLDALVVYLLLRDKNKPLIK